MTTDETQWVRAKGDPEVYGDALWHVLEDGSTKCDQQAVMPAITTDELGGGRQCPDCLEEA